MPQTLTIRGTSTRSQQNVSSISPPNPPVGQRPGAGDVMLLIVGLKGRAGEVRPNVPAGWTAKGDFNLPARNITVTAFARQFVAGDTPPTVNWPGGTVPIARCAFAAIRGCTSGSLPDTVQVALVPDDGQGNRITIEGNAVIGRLNFDAVDDLVVTAVYNPPKARGVLALAGSAVGA